MRIICTGSAGFIGRHTVRALRVADHDVMGIDRNSAEGEIRADITDAAALKRAFEHFRPEAVLHLAANASLQRSVTDAVYDAMQNVIGTITVLGAAQKYGCKRFVFASTSAVYAPDEDGIYFEDSLIAPQVPYGVSKAAGEMYCACSGISYAVLRYGNVYGPGQKPLGENILIAKTLAHVMDGEPFQINGDGEQVRDWVYINDVAEANLVALLSHASGVFNVATGKGASVNEVVDKLKKLTGYEGEIKHGPAKEGELRNVVLDSQLAKSLLGWEAETRLIHGLAETVKAWSK